MPIDTNAFKLKASMRWTENQTEGHSSANPNTAKSQSSRRGSPKLRMTQRSSRPNTGRQVEPTDQCSEGEARIGSDRIKPPPTRKRAVWIDQFTRCMPYRRMISDRVSRSESRTAYIDRAGNRARGLEFEPYQCPSLGGVE